MALRAATGVHAQSSRRCAGWLIVPVAIVAFALPASAQAPFRPSVQHNIDAMCLKADIDGDDYRPYVCDPDPVCTVLDAWLVTLDSSSTCTEPSPGDYHVRTEALRDAHCWGECSLERSVICDEAADCGPKTSTCELVSLPEGGSGFRCLYTGEVCSVDGDCPPVTNVCTTDDASSNPIGVCLPESPASVLIVCAVDADCPAGFTCSVPTTIGGFPVTVCGDVRPECDPPNGVLSTPVVCDSIPDPPVIELLGVSDDLAAPSAVSVTRPDASTTQINHGDAMACIARIETIVGEACSPGL